MKIGILTFHAVPNYGAVFQAYGLQRYLRDLGHEVFFIDYRPAYLTTGGRFHMPLSSWHAKANVVIAYQKWMHLKASFNPAMRQQDSYFANFVSMHFSLSPECYRSPTSLRAAPPDCDVYIAGSDQIWNPSAQQGVDPACFLDFGPSSVKRVAYAASFGRPSIPNRHHPEIAKLASAFDFISIRENSGCEILKSISGLNSTQVPDPTFLIDWNQLIEADSNINRDKCNNTLFSYVLRSGDGLYDLQKNLADSLSLDVIQPLNPHQRWKSFGEVKAMTPVEWLSSIQNSTAVLTNSFHGTVFAILFNRPFLTVKLDGAKSGLNARMDNLLANLGLLHRQIGLEEADLATPRMLEPIDWDTINQRVENMRNQGAEFLAHALA